ncbi:MAG: tRNA-dependent cyclodipeptide synthase [Prochloraceae cyanobacterium]|nr:tRNA-dependent cyclodipeptide synthase [Prochloraceae cyanobacterium]
MSSSNIDKLQNFLNSYKIKYITISHSLAYTTQELANYKSTLGMDLIEAVLVEIKDEKIAMAVVPASLQINLGSLREALDTTEIKLLEEKKVESLFPDCEFGTVPPFGHLYEMEVFLAPDLAQNQEVAFYAFSYNNLVRMKYSDFKKLVNPQKEIVFLNRAIYRANVTHVIPEFARKEFKDSEHCFLALSLENESFSTAKLIAITDWISKNFKKCTVIIADSLHRITLQINRGLKENRALNKALLLGREYIDKESVVFERHANTCHFDFVFCSEIQKSEDYFKYYEQLQHLFRHDKKFANSVESFARDFILRNFEQNAEYFERYVEMSCTYLLEELAICAYLVQYGLSVIIYPGSWGTIGEIVEGHHPDVPDCLKRIIPVSLRLRRR